MARTSFSRSLRGTPHIVAETLSSRPGRLRRLTHQLSIDFMEDTEPRPCDSQEHGPKKLPYQLLRLLLEALLRDLLRIHQYRLIVLRSTFHELNRVDSTLQMAEGNRSAPPLWSRSVHSRFDWPALSVAETVLRLVHNSPNGSWRAWSPVPGVRVLGPPSFRDFEIAEEIAVVGIHSRVRRVNEGCTVWRHGHAEDCKVWRRREERGDGHRGKICLLLFHVPGSTSQPESAQDRYLTYQEWSWPADVMQIRVVLLPSMKFAGEPRASGEKILMRM